jgi:hypothetical protein
MLLLLLLHFAGFRKPKVLKRFDFVQRFFLFSFLDFSLLLLQSALSLSLSLSLYKQNIAQIPLLLDPEAISTRIQALWWLQDFTAIAISTAA